MNPTRRFPSGNFTFLGRGATCRTSPGAAQRHFFAATRRKSTLLGSGSTDATEQRLTFGVVSRAVVFIAVQSRWSCRHGKLPCVTQFTHSVSCAHERGGALELDVHPRSSCGIGNHGVACAPDCSVEMSASREFSIAFKGFAIRRAVYELSGWKSTRVRGVNQAKIIMHRWMVPSGTLPK